MTGGVEQKAVGWEEGRLSNGDAPIQNHHTHHKNPTDINDL